MLTRWLPLVAALFAAPLAAGCNTYHYYDITVGYSAPVTFNEVSVMQFCQILVTGADSHTITWTQNMACPPMSANGTIGKFEYSTFADSGTLTFTFNGYDMNLDPSMLCTSAVLQLDASSTITNTGMINVSTFDTTKCPTNITTQHPG